MFAFPTADINLGNIQSPEAQRNINTVVRDVDFPGANDVARINAAVDYCESVGGGIVVINQGQSLFSPNRYDRVMAKSMGPIILKRNVIIYGGNQKPVIDNNAIPAQGGVIRASDNMPVMITTDYASPHTLARLTWSGGVVTGTTTAPHGVATGTSFPIKIAGATPSAYNAYVNAVSTGASTFTFALANPGGNASVPGNVKFYGEALITGAGLVGVSIDGGQSSSHVVDNGVMINPVGGYFYNSAFANCSGTCFQTYENSGSSWVNVWDTCSFDGIYDGITGYFPDVGFLCRSSDSRIVTCEFSRCKKNWVIKTSGALEITGGRCELALTCGVEIDLASFVSANTLGFGTMGFVANSRHFSFTNTRNINLNSFTTIVGCNLHQIGATDQGITAVCAVEIADGVGYVTFGESSYSDDTALIPYFKFPVTQTLGCPGWSINGVFWPAKSIATWVENAPSDLLLNGRGISQRATFPSVDVGTLSNSQRSSLESSNTQYRDDTIGGCVSRTVYTLGVLNWRIDNVRQAYGALFILPYRDTLANLLAKGPIDGDIAWCTNARVGVEGSGAGTGCMVQFKSNSPSGTNQFHYMDQLCAQVAV